MYTALMVILAIDSIILTVSVLLQPGKSDGLSGSIAGGAEQLFGSKRANAYEKMLHRITIVSSVVLIILSVWVNAIAA
ncbi:protein translocase subunit secG [Eubacterium pyruvativorans]|uniref:Protein-export membrane protein SecG n=1 Tax=Eubacterium pyruvativorans TaxID=155865 RepID=A0A1I7F0K2_9FIRM|nr:preprotein translocase subunit SecG [Eubacterium pyruvativorans]MDO5567880.1 preprotein translocase subunit SecG [Eubacteriales bacterium]HAT82368.1 preprotein translocase subunit SecG [Eubacterium sp.]MCI5747118.1 preprotein translocase subunit SecG [Eubacterium pyruvativorans]MDD7684016.1 preprotein translocase subunit SecG [Eubacterium pyruvativorans]MDY4049434.1 preprotein translocase subunit SecG [Eubacterium pyruvativorans]